MKKGFTLSEVLTTLAILGVISAMTLPVMISNTNAKKFEVSAKKTFSLLSNVFELANMEGEAITDVTSLKTDRTIFGNYVKVIPDPEDAAADKVTLKDGSIIDFSNDGFLIIDVNGADNPNLPNYDQLKFNVSGTNGNFEVTPQGEVDEDICQQEDETYACTEILVYGLDGLFY